ncbi:cytochrome c oxidase subunit 4 isoform 1, mitochondrial-like [Bactrocera tryoni]|uniref:cytochrome c oxidase subunit 4 isoform 1, mitochondrial-like n=1 Tax=Bactrocera tryoni TaxID=59916 RepID=UPI001A99B13C|nr:cytochrome c oxidase subunit 4 isoform 1, mitochondrial-like [Bactrocera tryoni]
MQFSQHPLERLASRFGIRLTICRQTHSDQVMERIGKREIVGYGWNGSPCYHDRLDYPMPAVRFREPDPEICALREKETGDWRKLSIDEKKQLYRYSFRKTFAEMKAPTSDWKFSLGAALIAVSIGIWLSQSYAHGIYPEYPETFDEKRRSAQLKRMIALEVNPVTGLASKWDYEKDRWK